MPETARKQTVPRADRSTEWLEAEQCDGDTLPPMPPKRTYVVRGRITKVSKAEPVGVEPDELLPGGSQ